MRSSAQSQLKIKEKYRKETHTHPSTPMWPDQQDPKMCGCICSTWLLLSTSQTEWESDTHLMNWMIKTRIATDNPTLPMKVATPFNRTCSKKHITWIKAATFIQQECLQAIGVRTHRLKPNLKVQFSHKIEVYLERCLFSIVMTDCCHDLAPFSVCANASNLFQKPNVKVSDKCFVGTG